MSPSEARVSPPEARMSPLARWRNGLAPFFARARDTRRFLAVRSPLRAVSTLHGHLEGRLT